MFSYNIAALSFNPNQLAQEIKNHIPEFEMSYKSDYRQEIADSWPHNIDDSAAFKDWNWKSSVNLQDMTSDMLKNIGTLITE